MRYIIILLMFLCVNAEAAKTYIDTEKGGSPSECDGSVCEARNPSKKCAINSYWKNGTYSKTSTEEIVICGGSYNISIQAQDIWIPVSTFVASPLQYIHAVKNGRKVFFRELGGVAWELQLKKY